MEKPFKSNIAWDAARSYLDISDYMDVMYDAPLIKEDINTKNAFQVRPVETMKKDMEMLEKNYSSDTTLMEAVAECKKKLEGAGSAIQMQDYEALAAKGLINKAVLYEKDGIEIDELEEDEYPGEDEIEPDITGITPLEEETEMEQNRERE